MTAFRNSIASLFVINILFACICVAEDGDFGEWTTPFDGKTLQGWNQFVGTAPFTVENGTIVGRTVVGSPSSYLCTEKTFGNFELEFEVNATRD